MDAKCYMTQFNLNWCHPHRSHINSPPRWHFCCLCKRTQLYQLTDSYDQQHRKDELCAQGKKIIRPIFCFLMMHLGQWHCLRCHLGWQCSPALPTMALSTMAQPTMEYLIMAQPLFAPPKTAPPMHPLHQVHLSLLPQPMLHHEGTLIKRGPFWVGNKKYRAGLSLGNFFISPLS